MSVKIKEKTKWKSLAMEPGFKGFSEGFLGIEELTDYTLVKKNKKSGKVQKKNLVAPETKREDFVGEGDSDDAEDASASEESSPKKRKAEDSKDEPKKKKKKTRQKRKKKVKKDKVETPEDDEGSIVDEDDVKEQPEASFDVKTMPEWNEMFVPEPVLHALHDQGFHSPTAIQKLTLPAAIKGHMDIVGAAETGSGKTLAFGIPILHGILNDRNREGSSSEDEDSNEETPSEKEEEKPEEVIEAAGDDDDKIGCVKVIDDADFDFEIDETAATAYTPSKKLQALILTPTRELAIQVKNHIQKAAKYTDIKVVAVVGGMAPQKQLRLLSQSPEIVVATPGRLWDLIQEGNPHLSQVRSVRYLAIDETDRMIEKGHFEELTNLLEMVNEDKKVKEKRQTFVFSATLSLVHDMPKHLQRKKNVKKMTPKEKLEEVMAKIGVKPKAKIVDITRKVGTAETLTESRIHCAITEKDFYLYYFLTQHPGRTLIFCNSIDCVRRLVNLFGILQCEPLGLHAQMHQKQRLKNLERFSANNEGFLIATDVAARGLDIPNVEHVIHYQVPRTSESYVHRSGRTARASKDGLSVMFIEPAENQAYKKMCKTLNRADDLPAFPIETSLLAAVKKRVNVARDLDKLLLSDRKQKVSKSWWKKAAEEADLEISDEDSDEAEQTTKEENDLKWNIQVKQAELNSLLAQPLINYAFSGKYPTKMGKLEMTNEGTHKKSALQSIEDDAEKTQKLLKGTKKKNKFKKRKPKKKKAAA